MSTRKLRPYFQAHPVTVLTDQPPRKILQKFKTSGRLINWAIELGEFDIQIKPRPAIKPQVLADFIVERPDYFIAEYALRLDFKAINNEAEYEALIAGIALATELRANRIRVHSDSQLVVSQVNGFSEAKEERMIKYLEKVRKEISTFEEFQIVQVPRTLNTRADALSKMASSGIFEPENIYTEILPQPSAEREEILQLNEEPSWMDPIVRYLRDGVVPSDRKEAQRLVAKATHYIFDGQELYKRSFSWPLLKCLRPSATELAMRELHKGICGVHSGGKVVQRLLRKTRYRTTVHLSRPSTSQRTSGSNQSNSLTGIEETRRKPPGLMGRRITESPLGQRTTRRTATGESPFSLAFGVDAVIPVEIGAHSPRLEAFNERTNPNHLTSSLDLVEETREKARVRMAAYQHRVARYYNSRMKERVIRMGDLVL
ncbi:uncharacterized protein LOC143885869 [Tasmannia lanceolata]|uniref:uncharacterized protein LOC143885869 n=1 Tax=Tasmannia lanceolata TaxID=3420 RepID=UPI004064949C